MPSPEELDPQTIAELESIGADAFAGVLIDVYDTAYRFQHHKLWLINQQSSVEAGVRPPKISLKVTHIGLAGTNTIDMSMEWPRQDALRIELREQTTRRFAEIGVTKDEDDKWVADIDTFSDFNQSELVDISGNAIYKMQKLMGKKTDL